MPVRSSLQASGVNQLVPVCAPIVPARSSLHSYGASQFQSARQWCQPGPVCAPVVPARSSLRASGASPFQSARQWVQPGPVCAPVMPDRPSLRSRGPARSSLRVSDARPSQSALQGSSSVQSARQWCQTGPVCAPGVQPGPVCALVVPDRSSLRASSSSHPSAECLDLKFNSLPGRRGACCNGPNTILSSLLKWYDTMQSSLRSYRRGSSLN
ncbi:uncharacterized protein LOC134799433 [Cydia splendana]|uniref:uncharacterized protein LOC134799433 n=1 Tax=Cydia splendana TaxID=1100963 RepID=UPI00300C23F9